MKIVNLYCMPGMAASPKIFEFISLPKPFKIHLLSWIPPLKNEPLTDYAIRMCERVTQINPILVGVSFGGVLVQEMSKYLPGCQVVIVSSIKSKDELPLSMKMAKKTNAHKLSMISAFVLSSVFLISYVTSKLTNDPVPFGGEGFIRITYFFVLITHIILSVAVLPLALFSIYRGITGEFDKHKKIVKWTFPIWMYVAITGVMVYIFMTPYY